MYSLDSLVMKIGHHCVAILLAKILIWATFSQLMYKFSFCLTPDILFFKIKKFNWKCKSLDKISLHEEVKVLFEYIRLYYFTHSTRYSFQKQAKLRQIITSVKNATSSGFKCFG